MALAKIDDIACIEARLSLPRVGVWVLDAVVDTAETLSGTVSATVGALTLSGYVLRAESYLNALRVRVIGGAGGLLSTATPKFWQQAQSRDVVFSLLQSAGETLDTSSSLTAWIQWYAVGSGTVGAEVAALASKQGTDYVWRVLPSGAVWVGEDSWAETDAALVEIDRDPIDRLLVFGTDAPALLPGTTYEDLRIDLVEHHVRASAVRSLAWWTA
jgi:hypothetical protein